MGGECRAPSRGTARCLNGELQHNSIDRKKPPDLPDAAQLLRSILLGGRPPPPVQVQPGAKQSSRLCHPDGGGIPLIHRLSRLAAGGPAALRPPPLWLARQSDRRQRALVRLRPVLCIPIRLSDALDVSPVRTVRLAKPVAQGKQTISV